MSARSSPQPDASHQPVRRLKLVVNTQDRQAEVSQPNSGSVSVVKEESSSPTRPSYSPVTPTLPHASLTDETASEERWIDEPPSLPVSLDDNTDAIALKATITLLQMQRQQSLNDIRNLDKMKREAMHDPQAFVNDLKSGKLQKTAVSGISFDDLDDSDEETKHDKNGSEFGKLPVAQNIARCPPIEWSKYHIAGEALNQMHDLQKKYPGVTEQRLAQGPLPQAQEIAAPYRPFVDKLDTVPSKPEGRNYDR